MVPTFDPEVATYFILDGGPHLRAAARLLSDLAANLPDHPLARYYTAYQTLISSDGFRRPRPRRAGGGPRPLETVIPASPNPELYAKALGTVPEKPAARHLSAAALPFSNIFFERLARGAVGAFAAISPDVGERAHALARKELVEKRDVPLDRVLPPSSLDFWSEPV